MTPNTRASVEVLDGAGAPTGQVLPDMPLDPLFSPPRRQAGCLGAAGRAGQHRRPWSWAGRHPPGIPSSSVMAHWRQTSGRRRWSVGGRPAQVRFRTATPGEHAAIRAADEWHPLLTGTGAVLSAKWPAKFKLWPPTMTCWTILEARAWMRVDRRAGRAERYRHEQRQSTSASSSTSTAPTDGGAERPSKHRWPTGADAS